MMFIKKEKPEKTGMSCVGRCLKETKGVRLQKKDFLLDYVIICQKQECDLPNSYRRLFWELGRQ
jgi:hypothetical protein